MLGFVFYSAFITFVVYYIFAKTNHILNRHSLIFTTVGIEFLFIMECLFGEFLIVSELVSFDGFLFFLFFSYVCFFLFRIFRAYIISENKDYTPIWWQNFFESLEESINAARIKYARAKTKQFKKEYYLYWVEKNFNKKLKFRYKLYVNFISYSYILLYILTIIFIVFLHVCILFFDYLSIKEVIKWFIWNNLFNFFLLMFVYRLFLSYIFPNLNFRHYVRFHTISPINMGGVLDSYCMSNSFMSYKVLSGKRYVVDRDFLSYTWRVLGIKRYLKRYYGETGTKYYANFNKKYVFKRYYLPHSWLSCRCFTAGALVDTPFYRFYSLIYKYKFLIFTKSLMYYLANKRDYIDDSGCVELSRHYEHNLKMNYKCKD